MSTAIQHYEGMGTSITQFRDPEDVLAEAQKAALALKSVLDLKPKDKKVIFNGEEYLEREDWGTVAKFYGCTVKSVSTNFVQFDDVRGFEAVAVVVDNRSGLEVGRAESMCLNDEENWGLIPKYEWQDELDENGQKIWVAGRDGKKRPKAKKVKVGEVAKPLFQLRSMAQTRAEAKALKSVFGWVVVLAGYRPTPAEEMTGNEFDGREHDNGDSTKKEPIREPQSKSQAQQNGQQQQNGAAAEISGIIESTKTAQSGRMYLTLKNVDPPLVSVHQDRIDSDMKTGNFIKFRGTGFQNERLGKYWELDALVELSPVQDGDAPAEEKKLAPDADQVAREMFPQAGDAKAAVQGMVDNGTLKPASQVDPKTIGGKRAQRIYALCSQNKDKNQGLNEELIKSLILPSLPIPLEHLRDLETGMYEQFEKWATGAEDWKAWLESD